MMSDLLNPEVLFRAINVSIRFESVRPFCSVMLLMLKAVLLIYAQTKSDSIVLLT